MLSEMETFCILLFVSWIQKIGDDTVANPTHSVFVIIAALFYVHAYGQFLIRLFSLEFVRMIDFYAVNIEQNY